MTKSNLYPKHPDLWLGRHFHIDAYVSIQEMPDGSGRILIKKPSGQVWAGEIKPQDRIAANPPKPCPVTNQRPPKCRSVWYVITAVYFNGRREQVARVRSPGLATLLVDKLACAPDITALIIT